MIRYFQEVEDMEFLKLSLYLTVMLGMAVYSKKQIGIKNKKAAVLLKTDKGTMK